MSEQDLADKPALTTRMAAGLLSLALVLGLAALVAHPFLSRAGLPRHTDAELHVFRAAELGEALRGGAGYVRWAPDFWYGYGYPIFNYYAPFTYYLANAFAGLPGLDIVAGSKAVFVLGILLAGLGAFGLGCDLFGRRAGLVAAAAYVLSPYLLLIDPHLRGDLPEFFALVLFPWLLRFYPGINHEVRRNEGGTGESNHERHETHERYRLLFQAGVWAMLIVTHNLMALVLSVIFVAWLVWQIATSPGCCEEAGEEAPAVAGLRGMGRRLATRCKPGVGHALLLTALAAGLSAFFWLPFVAERNAVHLTVIGAGHFDFHNHFVAWQDLFGPSRTLDMGATAPMFTHHLGLAHWLLALPALPLAWLRRRTAQGRYLLFFVLGALLLVFLMLSPSAFVWEYVPLMPYLQFPWRLLGPAALMLSMCLAGLVGALEQSQPGSRPWLRFVPRPEAWLSPLILFILLVRALPNMYPPAWPADFGSTTPRGMLQVELDGHYLGTTSTGDFVPSTAVMHPPVNPDLIASYDRGHVDKFDRSSLPPGASAQALEHGPTHDRFSVSSPQPFTARVLTFLFPGWRVYVDGQPVRTQPSGPYGLIEFELPTGRHDVRVVFGDTPPRTLGALISLLTLVVGGLLVASLSRRVSSPTPYSLLPSSPISPADLGLLAVMAAFAAFKLGVADPCDTCFRYTSPPGQALGAQYQLAPPVNFGHTIMLLGYDLPARQARPGEPLALTLYWRAVTPVSKNYQVFAHLSRPATTLWGQSDKLNPGDFPTARWPLDQFVWDTHKLAVLPDAPPGEYQLSVGLYTMGDGQRLPIFDAAGQVAGDSFVVPVAIHVLPAR